MRLIEFFSFLKPKYFKKNGTEWLDRRIRVQFCESPEMKMKRRQTKYYGQYFQSPYTMRGISTTGPFVMVYIPI